MKICLSVKATGTTTNKMSDSEHYDEMDAYDMMTSGEPLTVGIARAVWRQIRDESDDPEAAHSYEDRLMSTFICQIADGVLTDPATIRDIAEIIKRVNEMKFARWCA